MPDLREIVGQSAGRDVREKLEEIPDREIVMFVRMRELMERGNRVEFWEDPDGELQAAESRMHHSSDFA